jgi:aerobic carbon-monoxide dehydrogenase large subunit
MTHATGRVEDAKLLTGKGSFSADLSLPGQLHVAFVRAPHAHATIRAIDAQAATGIAGVRLVLTAAALRAAGIGNLPCMPGQTNADGTPMHVPPYPPLAEDRVRHVGQPVALVVAESAEAALDGAEAVAVEYGDLPAVADLRQAVAPDAPLLWPEAKGNLALDYRAGDAAAVDAAFARAAHVVSVEAVNQRVVVNALEPRAVVASHDSASDSYTLHAGSQGVIALRNQVAATMKLPPERLRVVSRDVGGAFGAKTPVYPEYPALLLAAKRLGQPVKWTASRNESFLSDTQGRDTIMRGELALDRDGAFLAMRIDVLANIGAYLSFHGTYINAGNFWRCLASLYRTPAIAARVRCVYTNTVPVGPYRGAGRPEANLIVERLVDAAARALKIDRAELRRRNLIPPASMPYAAPTGVTYDSGAFEAVLDRALALADHAGFEARRKAARERGVLRGIGIACFLELAGGPANETAHIRLEPDGRVALMVGTQSNGQGHATVFPRLAAKRLGIDPERVRLTEGDSAVIGSGMGSFASRSLVAGGSATIAATDKLIERGREKAAELLEASAADIEYAAGAFRVAGTDRTLSLSELGKRTGGLAVTAEGSTAPTFPNGCHICEVEIAPDTGDVTVVGYVAVDDSGVAIDPAIVEGQIVGGVAQGLGQVLIEHGIYGDDAQLLSGSFMDYALPHADLLPPIVCELHQVPCRTNPLGAKGAGEAGTTGALCAGYNAVLDALAPLGIADLEMPATPARVWQAIQTARA